MNLNFLFLSYLISVSIPLASFSQEKKPVSDSTTVEKKKIGVTYTIGNEIEKYSIDTTLEIYQHYDLLDLNYFQYRNTGNLGTAHFPIVFLPEKKFGFRHGYNQFDIYTLTRENIRHYTSKGPYTHLFFLIGLKKEQTFRVDHNQNIGKQFNFAFHYNRVASTGIYQRQETKHNDFAITAKARSKNEKYIFKTLFIFNNLNVQENGGVVDSSIFEANSSRLSKTLSDIELSTANSTKRELFLEIHQAWNEGRTLIFNINDSVSVKKLFPTFTLYHEIALGRDRHSYLDENPDSSYYLNFFPPNDTANNRNVFNFIEAKKISNRFGLRKSFVKSADSAEVVYRNVLLETEAEYAYWVVTQFPSSINAINELNLRASVRSHPEVKEGLQYRFSGKYSLLDYNANDLSLDGKFGWAFKKSGTIEAFSSYHRTQPDWIFSRFSNTDLSWSVDLKKLSVFSAGLTYEIPNPKFNFRLTGNFHTVKNLAYWNSQRLPAQSSDNIQIISGEMRLLFWIRHFGWDNLVRINYLPNTDLIRLPLFWSIHSLFYERLLFKKNLLLRVGIDIKYNTNYSAYGYFPLTGQFHLQEEQQQQFYPVMDFYFSFKVKTLRLFFKLDHINQKMFKPDGYFTAYKYPAPDFSFKAGISWMFYN